jgi:hypothetical protein
MLCSSFSNSNTSGVTGPLHTLDEPRRGAPLPCLTPLPLPPLAAVPIAPRLLLCACDQPWALLAARGHAIAMETMVEPPRRTPRRGQEACRWARTLPRRSFHSRRDPCWPTSSPSILYFVRGWRKLLFGCRKEEKTIPTPHRLATCLPLCGPGCRLVFGHHAGARVAAIVWLFVWLSSSQSYRAMSYLFHASLFIQYNLRRKPITTRSSGVNFVTVSILYLYTHRYLFNIICITIYLALYKYALIWLMPTKVF